MNRRKCIALILGITFLSSLGSYNTKAYANEMNNSNAKLVSYGEKIIGLQRYETAIEVSKKGWPNGATTAVLVNDYSIVDALSATPFADANNAPILLTQKDTLNEKTKNQLKNLGVKNVYIIGGEGVVSKKVEEQLKAQNINVDRIHGINRGATALEIAKRLDAINPVTEVAIVNGYNGLADAVSIAAVAADKNMPIILSGIDDMSSEVKQFINNKNITNSYIIGGQGVVSKSVENKVPNAIRIGGINRKSTNAKVIDTFYNDNELENIYVTKDGLKNENELIDALAVGCLAAKNNSPVILVSNNLNNEQKDLINTKSFKTVTQVGGSGNEQGFNEINSIQAQEVYNVSTINELNQAISKANANDIINVNLNKNLRSSEEIIINTDKKIEVNLKGSYSNVIRVTSPNLKLVNEGNIKSIIIEGKNNKNSTNLVNNGKIESLSIKNNAKVKLDNNGSSIINKLEIDNNVSNVHINNSGEITKLTDNSSKTTITGSGNINKPSEPSNPGGEGQNPGEQPSNPGTGEGDSDQQPSIPSEEEDKKEEGTPVEPPVTPSNPGAGEEDSGQQPSNPSEEEDKEEEVKPIEPPVGPSTPDVGEGDSTEEPSSPSEEEDKEEDFIPVEPPVEPSSPEEDPSETPSTPEDGEQDQEKPGDSNEEESKPNDNETTKPQEKPIEYPEEIPVLKSIEGINKYGVGDSAYKILKDLGWNTVDENTISRHYGRLKLENKNGVDGIDSIVTIRCDVEENDKDVLFLLSLMLDEHSTLSYPDFIKYIANGTCDIKDGNRMIRVQYDGKIDYTITITFYNREDNTNKEEGLEQPNNPGSSETIKPGNNPIEYPDIIPVLKSSEGTNQNGVGDSAYKILKDLGWNTVDENTISRHYGRLKLENKNGVDGIDSIVTITCDVEENDKDVLFLLSLMLDENSDLEYGEFIRCIANGTCDIKDGNRLIRVQYDGKIDYTITITFYNRG